MRRDGTGWSGARAWQGYREDADEDTARESACNLRLRERTWGEGEITGKRERVLGFWFCGTYAANRRVCVIIVAISVIIVVDESIVEFNPETCRL